MKVLCSTILILLIPFLFASCQDPTIQKQKSSSGEQLLLLETGWNTISFYVQPQKEDSLVPNLKPIQDQIVQMEGYIGFEEGMYNPSRGINGFGKLKTNYGYLLNVKQDDSLLIKGKTVIENKIPLFSKLQNMSDTYAGYYPIPGNQAVHIDDLVFSQPEQLICIHELRGGTFLPEFEFNTLEVLVPGKSYLFLFTDTLEMKVAKNAKAAVIPETKEENVFSKLPQHYIPITQNPYQLLMIVPNELIPDLEKTDYIAAFTQKGLCAGVQKIDESLEYTVLSIYSDDYLLKGREGFWEGEVINLHFLNLETMEDKSYHAHAKGEEEDKLLTYKDWNYAIIDRFIPLPN